ncbi:helix-turn-helix transcriptional regulator [Phytoactinopolyspora alkaliphila]|uniref:Helix-turn-helix transcriptional regulator n=1 Tax=Phytoactinopolyspora alkaliphila TaxID=1783498 RepID=A0A6N9YND1_9ACTN|nr:helix-turn-helix transcriptional regulator [Phytoactinopolyspora alkaliphila]NED96482.1 helix-turn-helix transcriptional regulator [Phytoactinopolyspora alkaliphila]
MHGTTTTIPAAMVDSPIRLRRDVYDALVAERGATTVAEQAKLTGIPERTLYRIRRGEAVSITSAMRLAGVLDVRLTALFERIKEDAR